MTLSSLLAEITHKPAVLATVVVLVVALLATVITSTMIKRRRTVRVQQMAAPAPIESTRIQRATLATLPDDMHQRLRYLTADLDKPLPDEVEPARIPGSAPALAGQANKQQAPSAGAVVVDDATHFFGSASNAHANDEADEFDGTKRFDQAGTGNDDATRFFGADPDDESAPIGGEDMAELRPRIEYDADTDADADESTDAGAGTRFFGLDDEPAASPADTQFFASEELAAPVAPAGTAFFAPEELATAPAVPTGTQYFSSEELDLENRENRDSGSSETQFFPTAELAEDDVLGADAQGAVTAGAVAADEDEDEAANNQKRDQDVIVATGMLHALPPMSMLGEESQESEELQGPDAPEDEDVVPTDARSTGPLPALPPSQQPVGHATLELVREQLATIHAPEVIALAVIDGFGRVLAGETDDDLTGELCSLMAESGLGQAADMDQPVRLGDDSDGALLLLPTGANALLGALVREDGDMSATRSQLRGLAINIGETMRRAS